ncbi:CHC2 zinc finger domain-containing protein [Nitrosospira sp. Is2]|uniref:CHC2 zinc finger domain-containing protein n=1 Tax=Nitrosospira sp. Is2 TaxID=3080532 RepID=UPI0039872208
MKLTSRAGGGNRPPSSFRRDLLPIPYKYYKGQGLKLSGGGEWKNALCPLHHDTRPSLLVHLVSGAFRCMGCQKHGGDVLSFHMQRYGLRFREAAKQLGAWGTRT